MHSYGSIYTLGHRAVANLFDHPVVVEEKVDGSQFSWGIFDGELICRSKGTDQTHAPDKLFARAVEYVQSIRDRLVPGWTYRGEVLNSPKHNTLAYDRVPKNHIALFDVDTGEEAYISPPAKKKVAKHLGLEAVPMFRAGKIESVAQLREYMDRMSFLGGQKIEGVVVKSDTLFGPDKKRLMAKHVSEAFKEVHTGEWRKDNPGRGGNLDNIIAVYRTPARWQKAVQHLRENGVLQDAPQDIGPLLREVNADVLKEEAEAIRELLFKKFWPQLSRGITAGAPEWYKEELLKKQFEAAEAS
jgi:hypothetical protein